MPPATLMTPPSSSSPGVTIDRLAPGPTSTGGWPGAPSRVPAATALPELRCTKLSPTSSMRTFAPGASMRPASLSVKPVPALSCSSELAPDTPTPEASVTACDVLMRSRLPASRVCRLPLRSPVRLLGPRAPPIKAPWPVLLLTRISSSAPPMSQPDTTSCSLKSTTSCRAVTPESGEPSGSRIFWRWTSISRACMSSRSLDFTSPMTLMRSAKISTGSSKRAEKVRPSRVVSSTSPICISTPSARWPIVTAAKPLRKAERSRMPRLKKPGALPGVKSNP